MPGKPGIDGKVLRLFDGHVHGQIARREFLDRAGAFTASGASAVEPKASAEFAWQRTTTILARKPELEPGARGTTG